VRRKKPAKWTHAWWQQKERNEVLVEYRKLVTASHQPGYEFRPCFSRKEEQVSMKRLVMELGGDHFHPTKRREHNKQTSKWPLDVGPHLFLPFYSHFWDKMALPCSLVREVAKFIAPTRRQLVYMVKLRNDFHAMSHSEISGTWCFYCGCPSWSIWSKRSYEGDCCCTKCGVFFCSRCMSVLLPQCPKT